jgi:hypothetical protein
MRTISRWLRKLEDILAPHENEEVRRLVELLRERVSVAQKRVASRLKSGHTEILLMVKPGICRLLTSCAVGGDASQRRTNCHQASYRYHFLTLVYRSRVWLRIFNRVVSCSTTVVQEEIRKNRRIEAR